MSDPVKDKIGNKRWFNKDGDGHAIEWADGSKWWYQYGECHRVDGPAIEEADGYKAWYKNGKLHRIDGPAMEDANGTKSWYLNGEELSEDLYNKLIYGDVKDLPLYLGLGYDEYISERLKE